MFLKRIILCILSNKMVYKRGFYRGDEIGIMRLNCLVFSKKIGIRGVQNEE